MSRRINIESELTAEEVEYLEARGRHIELAQNAEWLLTRPVEEVETSSAGAGEGQPGDTTGDNPEGHQGDDGDGGDGGNTGDSTGLYATLKGEDLRAEVSRRNAEREGTAEPLVKPEGSKNGDIIAALEADDARSIAS